MKKRATRLLNKKGVLFIVVIVIGMLLYLSEFTFYREFVVISGIRDCQGIELTYIERRDHIITLDEIKTKKFLDIFENRKYRRIPNEGVVFTTEFPDGIYTYDIFIRYENKNIHILPLRDRILIHSKMYEVVPSISDDVLQKFFEYASKDK
jgi:hypothetical protein